MIRLNAKESRRFRAQVEEDLKTPVGPVPTPRVDKAIEKVMAEARRRPRIVEDRTNVSEKYR